MNYWATAIARDEMSEPTVINLDSNDDDSLADTTRESEDEICLALKSNCEINIKQQENT